VNSSNNCLPIYNFYLHCLPFPSLSAVNNIIQNFRPLRPPFQPVIHREYSPEKRFMEGKEEQFSSNGFLDESACNRMLNAHQPSEWRRTERMILTSKSIATNFPFLLTTPNHDLEPSSSGSFRNIPAVSVGCQKLQKSWPALVHDQHVVVIDLEKAYLKNNISISMLCDQDRLAKSFKNQLNVWIPGVQSNIRREESISLQEQNLVLPGSKKLTYSITKKQLESFPVILHRMLLSVDCVPGYEGTVQFLPSGMAFVILDSSRFESCVLKKYFPRMSSFASFQRQLNLYDFERITYGSYYGAYHHRMFHRDFPSLCMIIKRKKVKRIISSSSSISCSRKTE
jgi:hypothetical protein